MLIFVIINIWLYDTALNNKTIEDYNHQYKIDINNVNSVVDKVILYIFYLNSINISLCPHNSSNLMMKKQFIILQGSAHNVMYFGI